ENEENVLMIALAATGAQLERICRRFRTAKAEVTGCVCDPDAATDRRIRARTLGGGMVKLELILAADEAELVLAAVRWARDQLRDGRRDEDPAGVSAEAPTPTPPPPAVTAADALVHL